MKLTINESRLDRRAARRARGCARAPPDHLPGGQPQAVGSVRGRWGGRMRRRRRSRVARTASAAAWPWPRSG